MSALKSIIKLIRVYQWIKSGFILMPFLFSEHLQLVFQSPLGDTALRDLPRLAAALLGFSFLASFGYVLNDWKDRELDRRDPHKCKRPLASGAVSPSLGALIALTLLSLSFVFAAFLPLKVMLVFTGYALFNIVFYSFLGKRILLLDVFIIAIGFVMRVLVGAYALEIDASPWLISVTFFIALFLGFSKRYNEVQSGPPEKMLGGNYNAGVLSHFLNISAALCIMNYALYCILGKHAKAQLYLSVPLVVLGIFRYYVVTHAPSEKSGNPSDVLFADRYLLGVIAFWVFLVAGLLLYFEAG